jgi:hypothetical protein
MDQHDGRNRLDMKKFLCQLVLVMATLAILRTVNTLAQVVTGPTSSTTDSIPTFTDATGKKISNNSSNFTWSPYQLNLRGITPALEFWDTASGVNKKRFKIQVSGLSGTGQLKFILVSDDGLSAALLGEFNDDGSISISGLTNRISDSGTELLYNGQPVGSGNVSNTYNTVVITNLTFITGNGNKLTLNTIVINTNGALRLENLPLPSVLVVGTNGNATNATLSGLTLSDANVLTASGGGGGSGVSTTVTPLAYSGTNITGFNCLTNNATYTLTLTNHCLFDASTFTGLPNTTTNVFFTLGLKQDSTGTWVPKFTNSIIAWADGVQPVIKTNANAVSYLYFHTHLFTNGMLVGSPNINVQ